MAAGSILVTRPTPEGAQTAQTLAALGYHAIVAPLLSAEAVATSETLSGYHAVAMTSARAADCVGPADRRALVDLPAFAVGDRTADAMRAAGFRHVRSADGDVKALAALIAGSGLPVGTRIAHIGGEERAGDLGALVASDRISVDTVVVYRMVPLAELPELVAAALAAGSIAAVLHYSPRSAQVFLELAKAGGLLDQAAKIRHICLSTQIAAPLRSAFEARITVARQPTESSLLEALGA
jgi:uroporphyrinogen-III synthase